MIKQRRMGGRMQHYHVRPVRYTLSAGGSKGDGWGERMVGLVVVGFGVVLLLGPLEQLLSPRRPLDLRELTIALIAIAVGVGVAKEKAWGYLGAIAVATWFGFSSLPSYPVGAVAGFGLAIGLAVVFARKLRAAAKP